MFYTYAEMMGNKIYHRYHEDGHNKLDVVSSFPIELFIKGGKTKDSTTIFGDKLSKIEFSDISDAREFIKEHGDVMPIYGQTSFCHQFLYHTYPDEIQFDLKQFKIFAFDIETAFGDVMKYKDDKQVKVRKKIET